MYVLRYGSHDMCFVFCNSEDFWCCEPWWFCYRQGKGRKAVIDGFWFPFSKGKQAPQTSLLL